MNAQIIKYFQNKLSVEERVDLLRKIEDDETLKEEFIAYRNTCGLLTLSAMQNDINEGKQSYWLFVNQQKRKIRRRRLLNILSYAASIAVLIIATYIITSQFGQSELPSSTNKLYVPAGQRAHIILSDGTNVWVNANSTITYPSYFKKGERRVELIGEAFFDVTKSIDNPFVVSTDKIEVKVLGTTFDICSYMGEKEASVSLVQGSVEVSFGDKKQMLQSGELLSYTEGSISISKLYNDDDFLWRKGIYTFNQVPLSQIIERLELYYDIKIIIKNKSLSEVLFTGKFRQRDGIIEILKIIQKVHPFKIDKDEHNNVITIE